MDEFEVKMYEAVEDIMGDPGEQSDGKHSLARAALLLFGYSESPM